MAIDPKDLIKDYYEEVKDQYGISFDKFNAICRAPFIYFRKMMESMLFPLIHIQYFGKFVVYPGAAKRIIKGFQVSLNQGKMTQEEFDIKTKPLKDHIEAYDNEEGDNPDSDRESSSD
jgi:hypothetical protein